MTEREPPYDINAERALIGAILLDRDAILEIQQWFRGDFFYLQKHACIYEAMLACALRRTPVDLMTVSDALRRRGHLDSIGGIAYLGELSAEVPTAVHVEYYARIVERTAILRHLIEAGGKITAYGYDERQEIDEIFILARKTLERIDNDRSRAHPRIGSVPDLMRKDLPPIRWIIPGLVSQGFGYLAAAPGTGKTWMLLQWALAVASGGRVFGHIEVPSGPALFLALEDTEASLQERIRSLGHLGPLPDIFYYSTIEDGWAPLDDGGLHQIENAIIATNPALVVIDTLTSISPSVKAGGNPYRAEYQSYVPVRALAERYGCAIIGSWHFSKGGGQRSSVLEMTSGTMGLPAVSVNRIGLVREPDSTDARLKSYSKRGREADWALSFDSQTGQWVYQGETQEHRTSAQRQAILDALEEAGTLPIRDLSEITGIGYNNLVQLLKTLRKTGEVETVSRGVYQLRRQEGLGGVHDRS
jgi:hypothetical protein